MSGRIPTAKWDEFARGSKCCALVALGLCLGCESIATSVASGEGTTGALSSNPLVPTSTSTVTGDSGGVGGSGASPGGTSAGGADPSDTSSGAGSAGGVNLGTNDSASSTSTSATATTTTTTTTGGQVSSESATHACLEYLLGFCEYSARCGGGPESVIPCFEQIFDTCPDVLFGPGSSRTVDGTFACADDWRALSCDLTRPECATAGTRAVGEPCITGIQCASRLCSGATGACGSCIQSAKLGETCNDVDGPQCEGGLSCQMPDGVCVLSSEWVGGGQAIGEECDPTAPECYPNDCRAGDDGVYHCEPYPTLGEDCSERLVCAYGDSYCDAASYVCLALPGAGEPCGVDASYITQCAEGLVCDTTLDTPVCLAPPAPPGPGEVCESPCQAGLTCRCTDDLCESKICQWARFAGESCASAEEACVMGECIEGTCVVTEMESTYAEICGE